MSTDIVKTNGRGTLLERLGAKYLPDTPKAEVLSILQQTAFKTGKDQPPATPAQVAALLVVADQYGLNPWTKEIYAFPDKQNGIVPVVGVDGWNRIANEHPEFAGEKIETPPRDEWLQIDEDAKLAPPWMRVLVYRKDREYPTDHTEYLDECYRPAFSGTAKNGHEFKKLGPWQTHTKRMLEHKARIQARRIAFGFSGIYDQDEAERIVGAHYDVESTAVEVETLGEEAWRALVGAAADLGFTGDDVLANAGALGFEGPGAEMPRDVAERLYRGLRQMAPQEEPEPEEAEPAEDAPAEPEECEAEVVEDESEPPGMDADEYRASRGNVSPITPPKADKDQLATINRLRKSTGIYDAEFAALLDTYGATRPADLTHDNAHFVIEALGERGGA